MPLPIPFLSYLILIMSTAFTLWLEKMFATYHTDEVVDKLTRLGWRYLNGGSYKSVYHKPGVPYLIKVALHDSSNKRLDGKTGLDSMAEFTMPDMINNLPYLAYGKALNTDWAGEVINTAWGIQEKCKVILYDLIGVYTGKRMEAIRTKFRSNPDNHIHNIGMTYGGRWVQFD